MKPALRIERICETPARKDGARILLDRLQPRDLSKKSAALTLWLKGIAPSPPLRKWFGHDSERWSGFRQRYRTELKANDAAAQSLREFLSGTPMTPLYAAYDSAHNHALVLADYLKRSSAPRRHRPGIH